MAEKWLIVSKRCSVVKGRVQSLPVTGMATAGLPVTGCSAWTTLDKHRDHAKFSQFMPECFP